MNTLDRLVAKRDLNKHPSYRKSTVAALRRLEKAGITTPDELLGPLEQLPANLRLDAVWIVPRLGRQSSAPLLDRIARTDRSAKVREEALRGLGLLGGKRGHNRLLAYLAARSLELGARLVACYELVFLSDPDSLPVLLECFADQTEEENLRGVAAEGVGNMLAMFDRRTRLFRAGAEAMRAALSDASGEVRFWAIFGLMQMNVRAALPQLKTTAERDHFVSSLGWSNAEEARDAVYFLETGRHIEVVDDGEGLTSRSIRATTHSNGGQAQGRRKIRGPRRRGGLCERGPGAR